MDSMKSALNLMRRLPPEEMESTFRTIATLRSDLAEDLLQNIDFPLAKGYDEESQKEFILSDFNSNGESYRSPWSNKYIPASVDGFVPSPVIRKLEEDANFLFERYTAMYYGRGVSSVYMWDNEESICGCFMILNEVPNTDGMGTSGSWHSSHLIEIIPDAQQKRAEYRLTTSIQLYLTLENEMVGTVKQNGTVTRQHSEVFPFTSNDDHLEHIGQMIEQMENQIRSNLDLIYLSKNQETVDIIRKLHPSEIPQRSLLAELAGKMKPKEY